jgi:hypothetical protein
METKLKIATLPKSGTCLLQNIVNWLKHNRQDRRLHAIEPAVDALDMMLVFDETTVTGKHRHVLGKCVVISDEGAGVAHRPRFLPG